MLPGCSHYSCFLHLFNESHICLPSNKFVTSIFGRFMIYTSYATNSQNGINTLRPKQNGCHFPDDIFNCISLNENVWILLKFSLKFVAKVPIDNIPALVQIMAFKSEDLHPKTYTDILWYPQAAYVNVYPKLLHPPAIIHLSICISAVFWEE